MSPFAATAVAVLALGLGLGLGLGLVTEAATPLPGSDRDRPGWYRPAGWVLIGLALVLLVLAVPTASETAPSHQRPAATPGPAPGSPPRPHPGATPGGPG